SSNHINVKLNESKYTDGYVASIITQTNIYIPPRTSMFVNLFIKSYNNNHNKNEIQTLLQSDTHSYARIFHPNTKINGIMMPRAILSNDVDRCVIRIDNVTSKENELPKSTRMGLIDITEVDIEDKSDNDVNNCDDDKQNDKNKKN